MLLLYSARSRFKPLPAPKMKANIIVILYFNHLRVALGEDGHQIWKIAAD
jgi:hypothetical protein